MMEIREIEVSKLKPWEDNPRINEHAVDTVANSIQTFGFNVPILYDQNFTIIAGHTRWKAAKRLGMTHVPAINIPLTDAKRKAFSIADNKTTEIADWDYPKLKKIFEELEAEDIKFPDLGFVEEDVRRMMHEIRKALGLDDDEIPGADGMEEIRPGDLISLGDHRLLCDDSRDLGMIDLLLEGGMVDHVFGGPPYFNQRCYAQWDNYPEYVEDMRKIIGNCRDKLKDGGVIVWNIANDCSEHLDLTSHHSRLFEEAGFTYLDTIIWYKPSANYSTPRNFHITRNGCYYPAFQWEALLVYQKPGDMPRMTREGIEYMRVHHTNVWDIIQIANQKEKYGHPAVCPVEIPYRSLLAYTGSNASVLEPFGGSGTTLIAAEKAGKRAFLMEKNPLYCRIIMNRWEKFTGKKAEVIMSRPPVPSEDLLEENCNNRA